VPDVPRRWGKGVLTCAERLEVQRAFAEALASQPNPQSLIETVFMSDAKTILLDLRSGGSPRDIAAFTLTACLVSRWVREPSLLEMLLEYLVEQRGRGDFGPMLNRVRQGEGQDPNASVYAATWLLGGSRPLFDRHGLRRQMRLLIEGDGGQRILHVPSDGQGFGRTYSLRFLEHLEEHPPRVVHVLEAGLSPATGPSYRVNDLLGELNAQFRTQNPLPERMGSSYPTAAALWLLKQMLINDGLWLVVLDGFGQRPLDDEVIATVEELARRVPTAQYRNWVRLVLLDYPHPLPHVSPVDITEEILPSAASISQADLMPCLEAWNAKRRHHGLVGVAAGELYKLADDMLGKAPPEGKDRLEALNGELVKLLEMPSGGLDGSS
jgi:hypothetical protein